MVLTQETQQLSKQTKHTYIYNNVDPISHWPRTCTTVLADEQIMSSEWVGDYKEHLVSGEEEISFNK